MDPPLNLNRLNGGQFPEPEDNGCVNGNGLIEVVFRDHRARLLALFDEARKEGLACLGAVAWLTDFDILDAMTTVPTAVLVQKEDFLRRDDDLADANGHRDGWRDILREHYDAVAASDANDDLFLRQNLPGPLGGMSLLRDQRISGIRCFGIRNQRGSGSRPSPLMHHKFLLFAKLHLIPDPGHQGEAEPTTMPVWEPRVLWTGSANLTRLTARSRENVVIIRDLIIGLAYLQEWVSLMCFSEPPDWDSPWVNPEWREGT